MTDTSPRRSRRDVLAALAAGVSAIALAPGFVYGARAASAQRKVTYYGDQQLTLPQTITRIATTWEAQNAILAMLGFGDRIVATTRIVHDMPVFRQFVPSIANAVIAGSSGGSINVEELIRLRPDVLFVAGRIAPEPAAQLQHAGIAVAALHANSMAALVERVHITGQILGHAASLKADAYQAYFKDNVARVSQRLRHVPAPKRLKVYHAVGSPLSTSARPSLNQDWMDLAGLINVAEQWKLGSGGWHNTQVSIEQIIAADPDAIIAMRASDAQTIRSDPRWRTLRAVREGRVHTNPRGMFWWCRETSEQALQFLWAASTLYPQAFNDIDMRAETRAFYRRFYGYTLSEAQISEFLEPTQ